MDSSSYIVLSRVSAQQRVSHITANNIANSDTPGYMAQRPVFAEFVARQGRVAGPAAGREVGYTWDRATWRDTAPGPQRVTSNPLDVAISGEGFFSVETPRGERYTRAGHFTVADNGQIVDHEGNALLSTNNTPIVIGAGDTNIQILSDGTVRSENGVLGRIRVVRFADQQDMLPEGNRLLRTDQEPIAVEAPGLVQGAVEGSNVQAIVEMTRMMTELRELQFATQFIEKDGERQQSVIDRLLRRR